MDSQALAQYEDLGRQAKQIVDRAQQYKSDFSAASTDTGGQKEKIEKFFELLKDRAVVPKVMSLVHEAMPKSTQPEITNAKDPTEIKKLIEADPARFVRTDRRQMIIESLDIQYSDNIDELQPKVVGNRSTVSSGASGMGGGGGGGGRFAGGGGRFGGMGGPPRPTPGGDDSGGGGDSTPGFYVSVEGRLLYGKLQSEAIALIAEEFYPALRELGSQPGQGFYIPEQDPKNLDADKANLRTPSVVAFMGGRTVSYLPTAPGTPPDEDVIAYPDPVTGEDMSTDWTFSLGFKIKLGEAPEPEGGEEKEGD